MIFIERDHKNPYIVFEGESAKHIEPCSNFLLGFGFELALLTPTPIRGSQKTFCIDGKTNTNLIPESFVLFSSMIGAGDVMYFDPVWGDDLDDAELARHEKCIKIGGDIFVTNIRRYQDEIQYQESRVIVTVCPL